MILLLAIAGISLTSSTVSWWNGRRTAEVQEQIDALEAKLAQIRSADSKERRQLVAGYLQKLESYVDHEVESRNGIATELESCQAKARAIRSKRFGSQETDSFLQIYLEIELALSRVNAERAYLGQLKRSLATIALGSSTEIPSPAALQLPIDFPKEGGLVNFDGEPPRQLYGYRLDVKDKFPELEGRAMLYDVDHKNGLVRLSATAAGLLEANLIDGGGVIQAKVIDRNQEGLLLSFLDAKLLLPYKSSQDYGWVNIEENIEVYPEIWSIQEITKKGKESPLLVRAHPRISGSKNYWSPILLSVSEAKLPLLVKAYDIIHDAAHNAYWRVHLKDSGQIAFSLEGVTLVTIADSNQQAFVLDDVLFEDHDPLLSVRFHAELAAFIPGTADDKDADRSQFTSFVKSIHSELSSQKQMMNQRQAALRLRKLSLIYQDQYEYLQANSSCSFLPGAVRQNGRIVVGTIVEGTIPSWLDKAMSTDADSRLRATGSNIIWDVRRAVWIHRPVGICQLELDVPREATAREIKPFELSRIELAGEGLQQQTLSKALEKAILGKFTSARVHSTLLGLSGDQIDNIYYGQDSVEKVLRSDEPVVAIWGPPGTGKTTLLVKWLHSLFDIEREEAWPTILIAAPTHVAVTKLLTDFLSKTGWLSDQAVRYANANRIDGTELGLVWHNRLLERLRCNSKGTFLDDSSLTKWNDLLKTREGRESATKWLLGPKKIHAVTCVGMARRDYGLLSRPFDIAIIDEAGKAFGAELLIPASVARKVVLVGDHNQLPPTVTTDILDEAIGYRLSLDEVEDLLTKNMFHEFFEQLPEKNKGMLTMQYRMHKDIGDIVSEMFYKSKLSSYREEKIWSITKKRLVLADFSEIEAYRHRKSSTSQSVENPAERQALRAVLARMSRKKQINSFKILVICPYEAQRSCVEGELKNDNFGLNLEITTVDAVQGGEADIVVLLMTRSHGRVQFLLDKHRLNVALSRAREAVVIFGHVDCLIQHTESPIKKLIEIGLRKNSLDLIRFKRSDKCLFSMAEAIIH